MPMGMMAGSEMGDGRPAEGPQGQPGAKAGMAQKQAMMQAMHQMMEQMSPDQMRAMMAMAQDMMRSGGGKGAAPGGM